MVWGEATQAALVQHLPSDGSHSCWAQLNPSPCSYPDAPAARALSRSTASAAPNHNTNHTTRNQMHNHILPKEQLGTVQKQGTATTLALLQPGSGASTELASTRSTVRSPQLACIWGIGGFPFFPPDPATFLKSTAELPGSEHSPGLILPCQPLLVPRWGHAPHLGSSCYFSVPRAAPVGAVSQAEPLGQSLVLFPAWGQSLVSSRLQLCLLEDAPLALARAPPNPHHRSLQAAKGSGETKPRF